MSDVSDAANRCHALPIAVAQSAERYRLAFGQEYRQRLAVGRADCATPLRAYEWSDTVSRLAVEVLLR